MLWDCILSTRVWLHHPGLGRRMEWSGRREIPSLMVFSTMIMLTCNIHGYFTGILCFDFFFCFDSPIYVSICLSVCVSSCLSLIHLSNSLHLSTCLYSTKTKCTIRKTQSQKDSQTDMLQDTWLERNITKETQPTRHTTRKKMYNQQDTQLKRHNKANKQDKQPERHKTSNTQPTRQTSDKPQPAKTQQTRHKANKTHNQSD